MKLTFFIFSSTSYFKRAQVAAKSVLQHHPEANIIFTNVDGIEQPGQYIQGLARIRLETVRDYLKNTAVKNEYVILLGADCVFYASLPEYYLQLLRIKDIVLVPHVLSLPKQNGKQLYRTGHVNADLVGFNKNSLKIIDWLLEQPLVDDCAGGEFYEQTWLSALPFILEKIGICRYPGLNYAYFNAHERQLDITEMDEYLVNGVSLVMAQFSGYIEGTPDKLSKYYNGPTPSEATLKLFRNYDARIKQ